MANIYPTIKMALLRGLLFGALSAISVFYIRVAENEVPPNKKAINKTWRCPGNSDRASSCIVNNTRWKIDFYRFEKRLWHFQTGAGFDQSSVTKTQLESLTALLPQDISPDNWGRLQDLVSLTLSKNEAQHFFDTLKSYYFFQKDLINLDVAGKAKTEHTALANNMYTRHKQVVKLQQKHFDRRTADLLFSESNQAMRFFMNASVLAPAASRITSSQRRSQD